MVSFAGSALTDLQRALNSCSVSFGDVRVVCDTLPGRAICAAAVVDGVLWLVLDFDKPSAPRHALAMLREACEVLSPDARAHLEAQVSGRAPLALVS